MDKSLPQLSAMFLDFLSKLDLSSTDSGDKALLGNYLNQFKNEQDLSHLDIMTLILDMRKESFNSFSPSKYRKAINERLTKKNKKSINAANFKAQVIASFNGTFEQLLNTPFKVLQQEVNNANKTRPSFNSLELPFHVQFIQTLVRTTGSNFEDERQLQSLLLEVNASQAKPWPNVVKALAVCTTFDQWANLLEPHFLAENLPTRPLALLPLFSAKLTQIKSASDKHTLNAVKRAFINELVNIDFQQEGNDRWQGAIEAVTDTTSNDLRQLNESHVDLTAQLVESLKAESFNGEKIKVELERYKQDAHNTHPEIDMDQEIFDTIKMIVSESYIAYKNQSGSLDSSSPFIGKNFKKHLAKLLRRSDHKTYQAKVSEISVWINDLHDTLIEAQAIETLADKLFKQASEFTAPLPDLVYAQLQVKLNEVVSTLNAPTLGVDLSQFEESLETKKNEITEFLKERRKLCNAATKASSRHKYLKESNYQSPQHLDDLYALLIELDNKDSFGAYFVAWLKRFTSAFVLLSCVLIIPLFLGAIGLASRWFQAPGTLSRDIKELHKRIQARTAESDLSEAPESPVTIYVGSQLEMAIQHLQPKSFNPWDTDHTDDDIYRHLFGMTPKEATKSIVQHLRQDLGMDGNAQAGELFPGENRDQFFNDDLAPLIQNFVQGLLTSPSTMGSHLKQMIQTSITKLITSACPADKSNEKAGRRIGKFFLEQFVPKLLQSCLRNARIIVGHYFDHIDAAVGKSEDADLSKQWGELKEEVFDLIKQIGDTLQPNGLYQKALPFIHLVNSNAEQNKSVLEIAYIATQAALPNENSMRVMTGFSNYLAKTGFSGYVKAGMNINSVKTSLIKLQETICTLLPKLETFLANIIPPAQNQTLVQPDKNAIAAYTVSQIAILTFFLTNDTHPTPLLPPMPLIVHYAEMCIKSIHFPDNPINSFRFPYHSEDPILEALNQLNPQDHKLISCYPIKVEGGTFKLKSSEPLYPLLGYPVITISDPDSRKKLIDLEWLKSNSEACKSGVTVEQSLICMIVKFGNQFYRTFSAMDGVLSIKLKTGEDKALDSLGSFDLVAIDEDNLTLWDLIKDEARQCNETKVKRYTQHLNQATSPSLEVAHNQELIDLIAMPLVAAQKNNPSSSESGIHQEAAMHVDGRHVIAKIPEFTTSLLEPYLKPMIENPFTVSHVTTAMNAASKYSKKAWENQPQSDTSSESGRSTNTSTIASSVGPSGDRTNISQVSNTSVFSSLSPINLNPASPSGGSDADVSETEGSDNPDNDDDSGAANQRNPR